MASAVLLGSSSSSAAGVLSYLEEQDITLKVKALEKLLSIVDVHWAEVCDSLTVIEELSEDPSFPAADLAAAIASKCFYHLQSYSDSLKLALNAGKYLDISQKSEYVDTLLASCIDEYKALRLQQKEGEVDVTIDPRMEAIVEKMFVRCYKHGCYEQAIGVALDTHRIDKLEEVCKTAIEAGQENILGYTFSLTRGGARNIPSREFRLDVIDVLVRLYGTLADPDYTNVAFALQYLNRPNKVAQTLLRLCRGSDESALQAYQIAFDLQEAENQGFVIKIVEDLDSQVAKVESRANGEDVKEDKEDEDLPMEAPAFLRRQSSVVVGIDELKTRLDKIKKILTEGFDVDLILNFLFKQSHADVEILNEIKTVTEGKGTVLHNATVIAHAFMNNGTTVDSFLRENLDWLGKANNWAKFTAVASIGVVHKGHVHESMNLLQPYLPQGGQSSSPYSESGALYALGLIHANKGGSGNSTAITYLSDALRNAGNNEVVVHGAALGIGLAAMGTANPAIFESLNNTLMMDSAVGGEGAALAIGLLMCGQSESDLAKENIDILLTYAHGTTHEKIVRGIALAISMMVYGKEETADVVIEQLTRDRDPILRYGGMYAIAMAYCGTSDNGAVRKLLHVAVSDVNDDVRRAAVTCIGMVMFRQPDVVPKLVSLLAESFNAHVRYGACMAIGVACAGTAHRDAIDLLTVLLEDQVDFVRQGAILAMALVLQQCAEARSPSVKKFREFLKKTISDRHAPAIHKSGAILASGVLDAGGRNCVVSMQSRAGFIKMGGAIGVMMFLQSWYWYPLHHFLSLALNPTMLIGLNKDFNMPVDFRVTCNAPPSMFAYPAKEDMKKDDKKLVATAVLSTTARQRAREARKEARAKLAGSAVGSPVKPDKGVESPGMGGDASMEPPSLERVQSYMSTASGISMDGDEKKEEEPKKKEKELGYFHVSNPSRLIPSQRKFVQWPPVATATDTVDNTMDLADLPVKTIGEMEKEKVSAATARYSPVDKRSVPSGIVMLIDTDPGAPENVTRVERVRGIPPDQEEAEPFEPFEWDPNS